MFLERSSEQKSRTLDQFYGDLAASDEPVTQEIGKTMLGLIRALRENGDPRCAWGLTSHYHLGLCAGDGPAFGSLVDIVALDCRNYHIEYRIPSRLAPWPNAHVTGEARSLDAALRMIAIAIDASEGWSAREPESE